MHQICQYENDNGSPEVTGLRFAPIFTPVIISQERCMPMDGQCF